MVVVEDVLKALHSLKQKAVSTKDLINRLVRIDKNAFYLSKDNKTEACKWAGKPVTQVRAVVIFSFIYQALSLKQVNHYSSTHSLLDFWRENELVFLGI